MTQFGQNLIPAIYEDNTFRVFSKAGFLSHFVRALQTVGMVPLVGQWPFDPIGTPEFALQQGEVYLFPFDFPSDGGTMTFNVNGTLYRPCVVVLCGHGNENATGNPTRLETHFLVELCIRIDGAPTLDNIFPMSRSRVAPTPIGTIGMGTGTSAHDTYYPAQEGHEIQKEDWLPYAGSGATNQATLPVGHWWVYLGPGGLHVQIGAGSTRAAFGDILQWGAVFAGARIPGRARPVLEDSNLGRINPTFATFWKTADIGLGDGKNFWDTGAGDFQRQIRPKIHRMQADLKFTDAIVDGWLFNLENVEYPFFPLYEPDTRPSPRAISGGGGGHILGRAILVPDSLETDASNKFGPVVPELTPNDVRPMFEDAFDCPGFRLCDVTAPLGVHTDPNTLLDWYLVPTDNTGQLVGVLHENGTTVSVLATVVLTAIDTDIYTLAPGGFAGPFPTSVVITFTGSNPPVTEWTDDVGTDRMLFTVPSQGGTQNFQVQWDITIDSGDADDTLYQVTYSAFNQNDPDGTASEGLNPLTFEYFFNGAWVVVHTIECAGANAAYVNTEGELSYASAAYSSFVVKDSSVGTPQLTLRWNAQGNSVDTSDGEVTAITINKFRYV